MLLMKWQLIKCVPAAVEKKRKKNELKVRVKFNISKHPANNMPLNSK